MWKRFGLVALLTLAVGLNFVGCGDDEVNLPTPGPEMDVRNGTWSLTYVTSWAGPDSCLDRGEDTGTYPDTLLCSFDLVGTNIFDFDCETTIDGDDVTFDCTTVLRELDPCNIIGHIQGTGTVTDTTIEVTASLFVELVGPSDVCSLYAGLLDACTEVVVITGQWVSDEDAENCPESDLNKGSVIKALVGRAAVTKFTEF